MDLLLCSLLQGSLLLLARLHFTPFLPTRGPSRVSSSSVMPSRGQGAWLDFVDEVFQDFIVPHLELLLEVVGVAGLVDEGAFQELVRRHGRIHDSSFAVDAQVPRQEQSTQVPVGRLAVIPPWTHLHLDGVSRRRSRVVVIYLVNKSGALVEVDLSVRLETIVFAAGVDFAGFVFEINGFFGSALPH